MQTLSLSFTLPDSSQGLLIAKLDGFGFTAYESSQERLIAYGDEAVWSPERAQEVGVWLIANGFSSAIEKELIAEQNWNADWEASIQPIEVGQFVVAPTWVEAGSLPADKTLIQIDPKMSFGTGYHESTRILLRLMPSHLQQGASVLDAGSGTGILAIAALKLGAFKAIGFDIDPWSVENAKENASLNGVAAHLDIRLGNEEVVAESGFDFVLGNMIKSILAPMMPCLTQKLAADGRLALAGLLRSERGEIVDLIEKLNLVVIDEAVENEWWGCVCQKQT